MIKTIEIDNIILHTNQIISPENLRNLYQLEKPIKTFETIINTESSRPFTAISIKERINIPEKTILLLRIVKDNQKLLIFFY